MWWVRWWGYSEVTMEAWSVLGATEAAKVYVARGDAILPAGEEQRRINAAQLPRGKPRAALAKERQKKRKDGWQTLPAIDERPIGEIRAARRKEKLLQKRPRTRKRGKGPKARPRWFKDTRPGLPASTLHQTRNYKKARRVQLHP